MDENVQPAEFLFRGVEQFVDPVNFAHVRFDEEGAASQFLDLAHGLFGGGAVAEEVDDHVRAAARKVERDSAPDAASRTGDEGDFVGEGKVGHGAGFRQGSSHSTGFSRDQSIAATFSAPSRFQASAARVTSARSFATFTPQQTAGQGLSSFIHRP
ncbi:MAG: hypothetical protein PGMFKBFP_00243 [Anaerolineales bacterium]|nr:hypothetical protein [Anaerolineales bacterium]